MSDEEDNVIWEAEFNPSVKKYWLISGTLILLATVVGAILIPVWLILGFYFTGRYLSHMRCALTERSIILNKGLLVRREKTVPLDKITDVAMVQGPIMRSMELHSLSFETAGQSANAMATLSVAGIVNAKEFRDRVLKQRDQISGEADRSVATEPTSKTRDPQLDEILKALERIESKINC